MQPIDKKRLTITSIAIAIIMAILGLLWGTERQDGNPACYRVINGVCEPRP